MPRNKIVVPPWLKGRTGSGTGYGTNKVMIRVNFKRMFDEHDLTMADISRAAGYGRNGTIMMLTRGTCKPAVYDKLIKVYPYVADYVEEEKTTTDIKE